MMIEIFEIIEILNKELQSSQLCINVSHEKVRLVTSQLESQRDSKFTEIWKRTLEGVEKNLAKGPREKRVRVVSNKIDENPSTAQVLENVEEKYRKFYFEVFSQVIVSLKTRFESERVTFFNKCENRVLGKDNSCVNEIVDFYNQDDEIKDFDAKKLIRERDFFLEAVEKGSLTTDDLKVTTKTKQNKKKKKCVFKKLLKKLGS